MLKPTHLPTLAALAAFGFSAHPAAAQAPAIGFTASAYGVFDNATDTGAGNYSLGFEFTANSADFVTALGYFDDPSFDPNDPNDTVSLSPEPSGSYTYADTHDVGLYQVVPGIGGMPESGLLLASTAVTSASTPDGDFLYSTLALPVALVPGDDYVVAGTTGGQDPFVDNIEDDSQPGAVGLTENPAITYDQERYTISDTLTFADSNDPYSEPGSFGPNLELSAKLSATPEPPGFAAFGLGLLGLSILGLRAYRRAVR